jgi:hypothetical protein
MHMNIELKGERFIRRNHFLGRGVLGAEPPNTHTFRSASLSERTGGNKGLRWSLRFLEGWSLSLSKGGP